MRSFDIHLIAEGGARASASERDSINKQKYDKRFVICIHKKQTPLEPKKKTQRRRENDVTHHTSSNLRVCVCVYRHKDACVYSKRCGKNRREEEKEKNHVRRNSDESASSFETLIPTCIHVNFPNTRRDRSNSVDLEPCGWYTDGSTYRHPKRL